MVYIVDAELILFYFSDKARQDIKKYFSSMYVYFFFVTAKPLLFC